MSLQKIKNNMYTPEIITEVKQNEIFVYGSNQFARHGAGSAKAALKFGAKYGDAPMGLLGNSYGIITKSFNDTPVTLNFIKVQVQALYYFAELRPDLTFYVTKIGTALAGFPIEDIADIFKGMKKKPVNIILPFEFS